MTLDKAIKLQRWLLIDSQAIYSQDVCKSIELSIEALEGFKSHRDDKQWWWCVLLPGETEE